MTVLRVVGKNFNDLVGPEPRQMDIPQSVRKHDLILVDDVQFLIGKERTQEEFFHTFNVLHNDNEQIVLTSDKLPKDMVGLEKRLRSRFEWGLIADLQAPDLETKAAILKKKSEYMQIPLPDDVAWFIARRLRGDVRKLEGALNVIEAYTSMTAQDVSDRLGSNPHWRIVGSRGKTHFNRRYRTGRERSLQTQSRRVAVQKAQ